MKQLSMTPELEALIRDRIGTDVDLEGIAVFEAIALNTHALPGKDGTIFEGAVTAPITLRQMADHLNEKGKHLPLLSDHDVSGAPHGRVFAGELHYGDAGEIQLRVLFYLDRTETTLIAKLNSGSLDEVSVSFYPTQFLCSECGWDYWGADSEFSNLLDRTCIHGHEIGTDGVHANLVGLRDFIELSLVARGAADTPKIVGKSESRFAAPTSMQQLAARGFDTSGLLVQASKGEKTVTTPNMNELVTQLSTAKADVIVKDAEIANLKTQLAAAEAAKAEAETAKAEAEAVNAENNAGEAEAALSFMRTTLSKLKTAKGETFNEDDLPTGAAELEDAIKAITAELTAILPVGGVSITDKSDVEDKPKANYSVFTTRKLNA